LNIFLLYTVNYLVVGTAVLVYYSNRPPSAEASEAELASKLAEGSYACMYLLSALSTLLASAEALSEVLGLLRRVEELLSCMPPPGPPCSSHANSIGAWGKSSDVGCCWSDEGKNSCFSSIVRGIVRSSTATKPTKNVGTGRDGSRSHQSNRAVGFSNSDHELRYSLLAHDEDIGGWSTPSAAAAAPGTGDSAALAVEMVAVAQENALLTSCPYPPPPPPHASTVSKIADIDNFLMRVDAMDVFAHGHGSGLRALGDAMGMGMGAPPRRVLVRQLGLDVPEGMRLLVTGPPGCGKSTLMEILAAAARASTPSSCPGVAFKEGVKVVACPQTPYLFQVMLMQWAFLYSFGIFSDVYTTFIFRLLGILDR
jgi:ABC-type multidrug transport system fused ATPase/permease subunit